MLLFPLPYIWFCISAAHRQSRNTIAKFSWLDYCNMLTCFYVGYICWQRLLLFIRTGRQHSSSWYDWSSQMLGCTDILVLNWILEILVTLDLNQINPLKVQELNRQSIIQLHYCQTLWHSAIQRWKRLWQTILSYLMTVTHSLKLSIHSFNLFIILIFLFYLRREMSLFLSTLSRGRSEVKWYSIVCLHEPYPTSWYIYLLFLSLYYCYSNLAPSIVHPSFRTSNK